VGVAGNDAQNKFVSDAKRSEWISRAAQMEAVMALPRIVVRGKKVILLSGYKDDGNGTDETRHGVIVDAKHKLVLAAKRNPDAVAFGYVAGEWVASA